MINIAWSRPYIFNRPWFKGRIWASHNIQFLWERLLSLYDTALTSRAVSKRNDSTVFISYYVAVSVYCFFQVCKIKICGIINQIRKIYYRVNLWLHSYFYIKSYWNEVIIQSLYYAIRQLLNARGSRKNVFRDTLKKEIKTGQPPYTMTLQNHKEC